MPTTLHAADIADGVRALTFTNRERKNALDAGFFDSLEAALTDASGVRAWLVRAEGEGIFSAGYDLTALGGFPEGTSLPDTRLGEVLDALANHPAPSVALITGAAIGAGCELAVACDFRVGSPAARFVMPPAKLGVVYALKGLQRLTSRVGEQTARLMFLSGRPLDAEAAHQRGLLDVFAEDAQAQALVLCSELAMNAPLAVQGMKRGFQLLETSTVAEREAYERLRRTSFNSDDVREGKDAVMNRRAPRFSGR